MQTGRFCLGKAVKRCVHIFYVLPCLRFSHVTPNLKNSSAENKVAVYKRIAATSSLPLKISATEVEDEDEEGDFVEIVEPKSGADDFVLMTGRISTLRDHILYANVA